LIHTICRHIKDLPTRATMATTPTSSFVRDDPATWTALGMHRHLKTGTMGDTFYKAVFGWDDT
jgi:hypothetical protein